VAKKFKFKGRSIEELKEMSLDDFFKLLPTRQRRSYKRGWTEEQGKFIKQLRNDGKKVVRTHCRDMIVIPEMVGKKIAVYNGKEFTYLDVVPEMVGHYLGEFAYNRKRVQHSSPGVGATRGSAFVSVK